MGTTLRERLLSRAIINWSTGCWEWSGATTRGYGQTWHDGRMVYAHRAAYELLLAPIPTGMVIDHLCRVPRCVNPAHMEPVTNAENIRRGESGERNRVKTHCANGHEFTPDNTYRDGRQRKCRACNRTRARIRQQNDKAAQS